MIMFTVRIQQVFFGEMALYSRNATLHSQSSQSDADTSSSETDLVHRSTGPTDRAWGLHDTASCSWSSRQELADCSPAGLSSESRRCRWRRLNSRCSRSSRGRTCSGSYVRSVPAVSAPARLPTHIWRESTWTGRRHVQRRLSTNKQLDCVHQTAVCSEISEC